MKTPQQALTKVGVIAILVMIAFSYHKLTSAPPTTYQNFAFHTQAGIHKLKLEIAKTDNQRSAGLMNRSTLPNNQGMLFEFEEEGEYAFWMKNTKIPLDLILLDPSLNVVEIIEGLTPYSEETIIPHSHFKYALELAAGSVQNMSIAVGDNLKN